MNHILLLKAVDQLPFSVGKKTLIEFVKGKPNPTIDSNKLDELSQFGNLYDQDEDTVSELLELLIKEGYLEMQTLKNTFKVVSKTLKGTKEIYEKKFTPQVSKPTISIIGEKVTDTEKKIFATFDFFLKEYNDDQKKAILSQHNRIMCVAGAGSGKTSVLTKRIEFLVRYKSVPPQSILAITFTRKARDEMLSRLEKNEIKGIHIETFNSFCEKFLRKNETHIYTKSTKVVSFREKIELTTKILTLCPQTFESISEEYFSKKHLREKTKDELFLTFVHDLFMMLDIFKNQQKNVEAFYEKEPNRAKRQVAQSIHFILTRLNKELKERGLRDFTDQIIDTVEFLKAQPKFTPQYTHILVDEFQDINSLQQTLLSLLKKDNLFVVGDPRQAIYGWRGSEISHILEFSKSEPTQIITIDTNYRSHDGLVNLANAIIEPMKLPAMLSAKPQPATPHLFICEQKNEETERAFIISAIKNSTNPKNEIFVLARTNRILENFADECTKHGILYTIKSEDESEKNIQNSEEKITLATVHAIKGLQAKEVYLISVNSLSFPNKVQDNEILAMIKEGIEYDKDSEELRLLYVAITRAKQKLIITYTGNPSKFFSNKALCFVKHITCDKSLLNFDQKRKDITDKLSTQESLKLILREWRNQKAQQRDVPNYMILSNQALDDLYLKRPRTKTELEQIMGIGPVKISQYGDEILKLING